MRARAEKTFLPIVSEITDAHFGVLDNEGDQFLIETNKNAPNGKVVLYDPKNPDEKSWSRFCPKSRSRWKGSRQRAAS